MLVGHLIVDLMTHPAPLLFPLSLQEFALPLIEIKAFGLPWATIVSTDGVILLLYAVILSLMLVVDDFLFFFEKKHEQVKQAIKNAIFSEI